MLGFDDDEVVGGDCGGSNEKLSKFKKPLSLKHAFILLRLTFTDIWIETEFWSSLFSRKRSLRCLIQNSQYRAFSVIQASRFGSSLSIATRRNQSEIVKRNSWIFYRLPLTMTIVTLLSLILIFRVRSSKPDHSAMFPSFARPSKGPSSTRYIPNRLSSSHNRRSCWCSVVLPSGPGKCNCECLALSASEKDLWGFAFLSLTYLSLTLRAWLSLFRALRFRASRLWASLSGFHHFEPHLVGSLHSFDLILTAPGPRFQNTRPISVMSMRHVSKRAGWRTYKDNGSGMKLSCRAI